jgi:putative heme iron utilization protein
MKPEHATALKRLLQTSEVAALATLHKGEPAVSMVPYALLPDGRFVIHVSQLATHTRDMQEHAGVGLLVLGERTAGMLAQEQPRASLQGEAVRCGADAPGYAAARAAYLARFPESEPMFGFGDFSLFLVNPHALRFVAGFAQAFSLTAPGYQELMAGGA